MQTRSSSSSSVATSTVRKQYTSDEIEFLLQKVNDKEKQLKEQAEALQIKQDHLSKLQDEIEQRDASDANETTEIMHSIVHQIEKLSQRMTTTIKTIADEIKGLNERVSNLEVPQKSVAYNEQSNAQHTRRQINPSPEISSPIRFKDAVETIPKFDGHKMSVFHFSKICERALELIPQYYEYHLVQLIINKLQGHAYAAVEGNEYTTVLELTRRLKKIFGPNKSVDQYRGELANIFMKPNENIFDYITRVQELRTAIIDEEMTVSGYIEESLKDRIEQNAMNSFINGLPSDLLIRVKLERPYNFENCISTAIQLSKTIEAENARKRIANPNRSNILPRADFSRETNASTNNNLYNPLNSQSHTSNVPFIKPLIPGQPGPNYPTFKVCNYCKNPGHVISECRKLAYKRSTEGTTLNPSPPYNRQKTGNLQDVPISNDVRRNESQTGRQNSQQKPTNQVEIQEPLPSVSLVG